MLKKTITFTDYNEVERTEDFYFNLTKTEVSEIELSITGGLVKMLERIIQEQDTKKVLELLKDIVHRAYGEKSVDGRRFIKNQELLDSFIQTEAYNELFFELITNADTTANFINAIIPQIKKETTEEVN